MRILLVNSERGVAGGLSSAVELASGLAAAGHQVAFICHPASELRRRLVAVDAVTVRPVAIRAELNLWRSVQVGAVFRDFRPDVVVADRRKDVKLSFTARLLHPGVALVHRHGAPSPLRNGPVYRAVWTRLNGMIVNSATMRSQLLERTPWLSTIPIDVIHNGKELTYWKPSPSSRDRVRSDLGIDAEAFVVSYHGVLQSRKRVDLLIRAAARASEARLHLLVTGPGEEAGALQSLAASLGVKSTFTGPRRDLPELLSAADAAVHLSVAEGFSNSVIEAMACGLPVIASDASSHGEQIENGVTGMLVLPDDVDAVAAAIDALAGDPERSRMMGTAARKVAEDRFGLKRMVGEYESALSRAVASLSSQY